MDKQSQSLDWLAKAKQKGYNQWLLVFLDVVEPIAPILAQGLWVAQPLSNLWGGTSAIQHLAEMLETPDGIDHLRQRLSDDTGEYE